MTLKRLLGKILLKPKSRQVLGFDDTSFYFLGCFINTTIMMGILYTDMLLKGPWDRYIILWSGIFLYMLVHWYIMRFFYLKLVERFPGYDNRIKRMVSLPLVLFIYFLVTFILDFLLDPILEIKDPTHQKPALERELVTGTFMAIIDIGIYERLHLFAELKNTKIKQARLEKEQISSQLINLKSQISPHFLFNSLNTLVYLIDTDREKSKEFVYKLSEIYERVLEFSGKDLVSLQEELNYINAYVSLLEKRFGTNLKFEFNISKEATTKMIIPLSMQTGVENAVKHNIVSKSKPLHISIDDCGDYLIIKNNLQKKENTHNGSGQGLNNIKNRYRLLSNKEMVIEETRTRFILKLPLIQPINNY